MESSQPVFVGAFIFRWRQRGCINEHKKYIQIVVYRISSGVVERIELPKRINGRSLNLSSKARCAVAVVMVAKDLSTIKR